MKIKKTLFTTEIEISVDEILDVYFKMPPKSLFFEILMAFFRKIIK